MTTPDGAPEAASPSDTVAEPATLQAQLAEERARAEGYYASWQRSAADFANYKRRAEQERADAIKFGTASLILNLLPVVDDLERALQNLPRDLAGLTWVDGVHIIHRKLVALLENHGVSPIEAVGKPFDPTRHEAVLREAGEEGRVLSELQRGYTLLGRVIRPSLVKVGEGGGTPTEPAIPQAEPGPPAS